MENPKCHYCKTMLDLRPYGPKGAMVCFPCAMATPEREAEAEKNFLEQVNAAASKSSVVIMGTEAGPYPIKGES